MKIGVVAEDNTDFDALRVLVRRIAADCGLSNLGVKRKAYSGGSKLTKKLRAALKDLERDACSAAIIVHDLDRNPANNCLNDEATLRRKLESVACPPKLQRLVCIPVEELEAWFWSDAGCINYVSAGRGKAHPNPHLIAKPKEALQRLSVKENKKPRYSTNDNKKLAEMLDLETCAQRCQSFAGMREFVVSVLKPST